jgi:DNA-binding NtrC family response regulator
MVTDLDMPEMKGLTLMRPMRERGLCIRSIVLCRFATIGNLTACLQEGALVILPKPLPSFDLFNRAVDRTL